MKIIKKKNRLKKKNKIIINILYFVLFIIITLSSYLAWNIFKEVPELIVEKVIKPENSNNVNNKNYIFLVTDDSDYINFDLSIERYNELLNIFAQNEDNVFWNVLFSGYEFEKIKNTDNLNSVFSRFIEYNNKKNIEIGYSEKNESKYQSDLKYYLNDKITFKDKVVNTKKFLDCGKDAKTGKCRFLSKKEGGSSLIKGVVGELYTVSGIKINSMFSFDFITKAVKELNQKGVVSLNLSEKNIKNKALAKKLINILSPTNETLSTLLWINNRMVISDIDIKHDSEKTLKTTDENININDELQKISKVNDISITPVYFGGTEMYSKVKPIEYAYKNGGFKKITVEYKKKQIEKENMNNLNIKNFELLIKTVTEKENFEFIKSSDIYKKVYNEDYNKITKFELDYIARWIIIEWKDKKRIPNWVYDGKNYYSLRDAFYLLYKSLSQRKEVNDYSLPLSNIELIDTSGPYNINNENTVNRELTRKDVMRIIIDYMRIYDEGYWKSGESKNSIEGVFFRGRKKITAAEMLYSMAVIYTTDLSGRPVEKINIPDSITYPETYELLRDGFGCNWKEECIATSWSLKPLKMK